MIAIIALALLTVAGLFVRQLHQGAVARVAMQDDARDALATQLSVYSNQR